MKRLTVGIAIMLIVVYGMLSAGTAHAKKAKVSIYEVTITNITRGQIISPPIVISHNDDFQLFSLGQSAPTGIAELAEDGDTSALIGELSNSRSVYDISEANGGILPGMSATVEIRTKRGYEHISAAGMLVTTNDAFFAVRGLSARSKGDAAFDAEAYDSGTEGNSEDCDKIPGPPCGNGGVRDTADAEGYVFIHAGIHGIGDLYPEVFDWRNPVATITIHKVK